MEKVKAQILQQGYRNISVVGLSKNAGKTVCLNALLDTFSKENHILGLTSSGRDGERKDVLTETEKPGISVKEGTFFTTTDMIYQKNIYPAEIVALIQEKTPMGRVIICRALEDSAVEIAGLQTNTGLKYLCDQMRMQGAEICFIDGSLDRQASASPDITEATILAVGAGYHRTMAKTVEMAAHMVNMFRLPEGPKWVKDLVMPQFDTCLIIDKDGGVNTIYQKTALFRGNEMAAHISQNTSHIYIPGALVYTTLQDILDKNKQMKGCTILISDATKIFLSPKEYWLLKQQGIEFQVFKAMQLLAVTVNPYAPKGYYYQSKAFMHALAASIKNVPIYDVVRDERIYHED